MQLVVLARRVFEKVIIISCSPQVFLAERSPDHEIDCGDIKTRTHSCLHASMLIFLQYDSDEMKPKGFSEMISLSQNLSFPYYSTK